MEKQIILTADGSHTLYIPELNEHYHSVHGAIRESKHVFIGNGFKKLLKKELKILEVGFGTGLNALLTFVEARKHTVRIEYTAIEPYPVGDEHILKLNYCQRIDSEHIGTYFTKMHEVLCDEMAEISKTFMLIKITAKLENLNLQDNYFDLIYFDAFAPAVQPEMWTREIFTKLFQSTRLGGIIVTYSAKGEIRRRWLASGYKVERLPGPPGKMEMLRGIKLAEPGVT